MIVECCSQERTYSNFYGLIGERFCKLNRVWTDCFQEAFAKYYDTIHRYETNKLRNIGRFFGHLLASDGISWAVFHVVHMNEEETTSSSRIFVKILMQEMTEEMGIAKLVERFAIPELRPAFAGMFPMDNPKNTRFAINYFTSIGLGKATEEMRTYLQNAPKMLAAQHAAMKAAESSDSDESSDLSSSDTDSSDFSSDESDSDSYYSRRRRARSDKSRSRSPPPRKRRYSDATDDSRSPPPRRRADSRSPPPARRAADSPPRRRRYSDERSPPPRRRSPSPSPPPARRSPPRKRYSDERDDRSPPPPRRYNDDRSPPPRRRSPPPPRREYDDRGNGRGGPGGRDDRAPPRRYADDDTPPRRR
jgi:pre-mRNA-splicing factor CWC22